MIDDIDPQERKAENFDYGPIEAATRPLLLRLTEPPKKQGKKKEKNVHEIEGSTCESFLLGSFTGKNEERWKIMGMRPKRENTGHSTEYDVHRYHRVFNIDKTVFEEQLPREKQVSILRVCRYDAKKDHAQFWNEYDTLKYVRSKLDEKRHLDAFPALYGSGEFAELNYFEPPKSHEKKEGDQNGQPDKAKEQFVYVKKVPNTPRPYYIMERLEPSLETILHGSREKKLNIGMSCHMVLGCIRALRILHQLGFALRNVQPNSFAIRLGSTGMLQRREAELSEKIVITDLSMCRRYLHEKPRRCPSFIGTYKYSSPEAMKMGEQTSVDDMISCLYMLHEFSTGRLPWMGETDRLKIIGLKEGVETSELKDDGGSEVLANYKNLYSIVRRANGYGRQVDYEALIKQLLECPEGKPAGHSLFGFQFPLYSAYRHGFTSDGRAALPEGVGVEKESVMKGKGESVLGGKHTTQVRDSSKSKGNRKNKK